MILMNQLIRQPSHMEKRKDETKNNNQFIEHKI